jgi:hypothetical protein
MKHTFLRSLIAVVTGNIVYFSVAPFLPEMVQHQPSHVDWGLIVDFWICLVCYGMIRFIR